MTSGSPDVAWRGRALAPEIRSPRASAVAVLLLAAAVAAVYLPTLSHGFVNWDDDRLLTANPAVTAPDGLARIWSAIELPEGFPNYPLVFTSYWVEHRLWGLDPFGFHAVNITLHALNACLVFLALVALGFSRRAAFAGAALFGVHPVQVESVAWIAERKNVLSASFYWSAFLAYLYARDARGGRWYALSIALFAAALLSKTATVVLPVSLLLADRMRDGRWTTASLRRVAPMLLLAALAALQTFVTENRSVALPLLERPLVAGRALWFYALELVAPLDLLPVHPRWELHPEHAAAWLPLAGAIAAAAWIARAAPLRVQWGLGHFAATLLPVLGLVSYGFHEYSFVAERNLYLACVGPFALIGAGIDWLAARVRPAVAGALATGIFAALALLTSRQIPVWADSEHLWSRVLDGNPGASVAYINLGLALAESGRIDEALHHLRRAVELAPDSAEAHNNLALALYKSGDYAEAERHCRRAVEIEPSPQYVKNLGLALAAEKKGPEAEAEFRRAVRMRPRDGGLRLLLGNALVEQGRLDEAIAEFELGAGADPDSRLLKTQLGRAYLAVGRGEQAATAFATVAAREPRSAGALYNLALAHSEIGQSANAARELERALDLDPSFGPARELLDRLHSAESARR